MNNRKRIQILKAEVKTLNTVIENTLSLIGRQTELIKGIQEQVEQVELLQVLKIDPYTVDYRQ